MPTLVELSPFDPHWTNDFSAAEVLLRTTLGNCVVSVDHIGSTAVPGLPAKPIIDIDITLSNLDDVHQASANLIKAGFEPRGNRYDDDVWAFLWKRPVPQIRVYLWTAAERRIGATHVRLGVLAADFPLRPQIKAFPGRNVSKETSLI